MNDLKLLHNQITSLQRTLRRELDRLSVRQAAIDRCRAAITVPESTDDVDEEDDTAEEIISNLDAIAYDLVTFKDQLRERLEHTEQGLRMVLMLRREKSAIVFHQYVLDEIKLCLRDAKVAREGYDELITNVKEISKLRGK